MLATISDVTHEMCSTHSTQSQIQTDGVIQTYPVVALEKIKGPTHMVEDGHHLRKSPHPPPTETNTSTII